MKTLFYTLCAAACMTSCSVKEDWSEVAKGSFSLEVGTDNAVNTRTVQTVSDLSSWYMSVSGNGADASVKPITAANCRLAQATGYTVTVYNYNYTGSYAFGNDDRGKALYSGTSTAFDITAYQQTAVSVSCGTQKTAIVNVSLDQSFLDLVKTAENTYTYDIAVNQTDNTDRTLHFTQSVTDDVYFIVPENGATFAYRVTGTKTVNSTSTSDASLASGTANLKQAQRTVLKLAADNKGQVTLTVKYDDAVTDVNENVNVNPY